MAAAEAGIFLEQALLDVEAERLGLMIGIAFLDLAVREAVHRTVGEEHLVQGLAAIARIGVEGLLRPDLLSLEAFGEFHGLPPVGARLARPIDQLTPEMGAPFGIAVG